MAHPSDLWQSPLGASETWHLIAGVFENSANICPAQTTIGFQAGVYNKSHTVYGFQIGLINMTGLFAVAPILNLGL